MFLFEIYRWNDEDDEYTDGQKTNLGKKSTVNEENNRKRKSRWNS